MQNVNDDIKNIGKNIDDCLKDIDPLYWNQNFNLMQQIVQTFGDVNFDKVKLDIERMNRIDEKLDKVIKLVVDKHSEEFFKILGFVRQIQKENEASKQKINEAKEVLDKTKTIIKSLSQGESSDWKLKSIYCSEIISKLNKTHQIFKIINECDVYIENNKLFDSIKLLKASYSTHHEYDTEFRSFNLLVSINSRFKKIEETIEKKIRVNLENILYFRKEDILDKKITTMLSYYIGNYEKLSLENQLTLPIQKIFYTIKNVVYFDLDSLISTKNASNVDKYFNENIVDLDSDKKLSSLYYIIKCLREYDKNINVFTKMYEESYEILTQLVENTLTMLGDQIKNTDFSKNKQGHSSDKMKFLILFQGYLTILFHTLSKLFALNDYVLISSSSEDFKEMTKINNTNITKILQKCYLLIEKAALMPMIVYQNIAGPRSEDLKLINNTDLFKGDSTARAVINDNFIVNIDFFPLLFKIYSKFTEEVEKYFKFKFELINSYNTKFSKEMFDYYASKHVPQKIFDLTAFASEFEPESNNFRFITETTFKIAKLKYINNFSFGEGSLEIIKILNKIFLKLGGEIKEFVNQMKLKCSYIDNFEPLLANLKGMREFSEITPKVEFKSFGKLNVEESEENYEIHSEKFFTILSNFIYYCSKNHQENSFFISRDFRTFEIFSRYITCMETLLITGESLVLEIMKGKFKRNEVNSLLEQVNSIDIVTLDPDAKNIETLIYLNFKALDIICLELNKMVLICKIEMNSIITNLIRNISKTEYWLSEPAEENEHFTYLFINEYKKFSESLSRIINNLQYELVAKDFMLYVNQAFINSLKGVNSNSINTYGIDLMLKNFEFIKSKISQDLYKIQDTIYYFPNYINTLRLVEAKLIETLKEYRSVKEFDSSYILPLLSIRTNSRPMFKEEARKRIISEIFQ